MELVRRCIGRTQCSVRSEAALVAMVITSAPRPAPFQNLTHLPGLPVEVNRMFQGTRCFLQNRGKHGSRRGHWVTSFIPFMPGPLRGCQAWGRKASPVGASRAGLGREQEADVWLCDVCRRSPHFRIQDWVWGGMQHRCTSLAQQPSGPLGKCAFKWPLEGSPCGQATILWQNICVPCAFPRSWNHFGVNSFSYKQLPGSPVSQPGADFQSVGCCPVWRTHGRW